MSYYTNQFNTTIHARISELNYQAEALAPKVAEETLDSIGTNPVPAGPRQRKAFVLVCLAYVLNALSEFSWDYTSTDDALAQYIPRDLITDAVRDEFRQFAELRALAIQERNQAHARSAAVEVEFTVGELDHTIISVDASIATAWLESLPGYIKLAVSIKGNKEPEILLSRDIPRPGRRFTSLTHGTEWFLSTGPYPFFGEHATITWITVIDTDGVDVGEIKALLTACIDSAVAEGMWSR